MLRYNMHTSDFINKRVSFLYGDKFLYAKQKKYLTKTKRYAILSE